MPVDGYDDHQDDSNQNQIDEINLLYDEINLLYKVLSKKLVQLPKKDVWNNGSPKEKTTTITLSETNAESPYSVDIVKVPANHILLRMDAARIQDRIFQCNNSGMCKCADYCLVASSKETGGWIVYIELKRGALKSDVELQLKGAKCLFDYGRSVVKSYFGKDDFLDGYEERYVCIRGIGKPLSKSPSVSHIKDNTTPESFLSLDGMESVHFMRCVQSKR